MSSKRIIIDNRSSLSTRDALECLHYPLSTPYAEQECAWRVGIDGKPYMVYSFINKDSIRYRIEDD